MRYLKIKSLPKQVTALQSLESVLNAGIDARIQTLSRLHAYPIPGHILGQLRNFINPNQGLPAVKQRLIRLRDILKFSSELMYNISLVQFEKFQLDFSKLTEMVTNNLASYGYSFTPEEVDLVVQLLLTNEIRPSSWSLDLPPSSNENVIIQVSDLYNSLRNSAPSLGALNTRLSGIPIGSYTGGKLGGGSIFASVAEVVPQVYIADKDDVAPLTEHQGFRFLWNELANSDSLRADDEKVSFFAQAIRSESIIYTLADMLLTDVLLSMMLSVDIWHKFVPTRTKSDAAQNNERADGLRDFAAFIHSLLVFPHIFRSEFFLTSYSRIEKWYGVLPVVPEVDSTNYKEFVTAFDFLKTKEIASQLFHLFGTKLAVSPDTNVNIIFEEEMYIYGVDALEIQKRALVVPNLNFSDLSILRDSQYDELMMSLPLAKFDMTTDIYQRILHQNVFSHLLRMTTASIIPSHTRFYNEQIASRLSALSFSWPLHWSPTLDLSPDLPVGTNMVVGSQSSINIPYGYPVASRKNERFLQRDRLMTFSSDIELIGNMLAPFSFDSYQAQQLREATGMNRPSYLPDAFGKSGRAITTRLLLADIANREALVETISQQNHIFGSKLLNHSVNSEKFSTFCSSFGLLFRISDEDERAGRRLDPKKGTISDGINLRLLPGWGAPYGITYEELDRMQEFSTGDYIALTSHVAIALLKRIPVPSFSLRVEQFYLAQPYYSFAGDETNYIEVNEFISAPAYLQFATRPHVRIEVRPAIVLDKIYIYSTAGLVMQVDSEFTLAEQEPPAFTPGVTTHKWNHDKMALTLEYRTIRPVIGGEGTVAAGENTNPLVQMNEQIEKEFQELLKSGNGAESQTSAGSLDSAVNSAVEEVKHLGGTSHNAGSNPDSRIPGNAPSSVGKKSGGHDNKKKKTREDADPTNPSPEGTNLK